MFGGKRLEQADHRRCRIVVEVACWLIRQDQLRAVRQRAGNGNPLSLASGKLEGPMADPVGQSNLLQQFVRAPTPFGPGNAREGEREFEILEGGQRLEEAEVLENEADA